MGIEAVLTRFQTVDRAKASNHFCISSTLAVEFAKVASMVTLILFVLGCAHQKPLSRTSNCSDGASSSNGEKSGRMKTDGKRNQEGRNERTAKLVIGDEVRCATELRLVYVRDGENSNDARKKVLLGKPTHPFEGFDSLNNDELWPRFSEMAEWTLKPIKDEYPFSGKSPFVFKSDYRTMRGSEGSEWFGGPENTKVYIAWVERKGKRSVLLNELTNVNIQILYENNGCE